MRWGAALGVALCAHGVLWLAVDRPVHTRGASPARETTQEVVWVEPPTAPIAPSAPDVTPVSTRPAIEARRVAHATTKPKGGPPDMPRERAVDVATAGPGATAAAGNDASPGSGSSAASGSDPVAAGAPSPAIAHLVHGAKLLTHDPCHGYFPYAAPVTAGQASLEVVIDASGHATTARIVSEEPRAQGFGQAALACAHTLRFAPAVDAAGHPTTQSTRMSLRFTRVE